MREDGLDLEAEPGPGGGVRLRQLPPREVALTLREIISLWLGAHIAHSSTSLPWSSSASSAVAKLMATLPPARSRRLRALARRIIVGPAPTRQMQESFSGTTSSAPRDLLPIIEEAMSAQRAIDLLYVGREGRRSQRRIEPHGLLVQAPLWYVLAVDVERCAPRMFRIDRIRRARETDREFVPDEGVVWSLLERGFEWRPLLGALRSADTQDPNDAAAS